MRVTTAAGFNRPRLEATASSTRSWCTSSTAKTRRPFTAALHRPGFESWTPSFTRPTSSSFFFSFSFSISSALKLWRRLHQRSHWARASAKNFLISGSVKDVSAEKQAGTISYEDNYWWCFRFWLKATLTRVCQLCQLWAKNMTSDQILFSTTKYKKKFRLNFQNVGYFIVVVQFCFGTDQTWDRFYKTLRIHSVVLIFGSLII